MKEIGFDGRIGVCRECGTAFASIVQTQECPDCSIRRALRTMELGDKEIEKILAIIHKYMKKTHRVAVAGTNYLED